MPINSRLSEEFEFACRYNLCSEGQFAGEKSVEIKCYDEEGRLSLDYIAIHENQVDEDAGLVGVTRVRKISPRFAIVDVNDGQENSTLKIPLKSLVNLRE